MTLQDLCDMFENRNIEIVIIDEENFMRCITKANLKETKIGKMIALETK